MASYPQEFNRLINQIQRLPGIGRRTAERLALDLFDWKDRDLNKFADTLQHLHERVKSCESCGNFSDAELCSICTDSRREGSTICVLESPGQISTVEKSATYRGLYHILGGKLKPLDGIGPSQLNIDSLHKRCQNTEVKEVILATSADVEGEATASYLSELLQREGLSISRIALGIPVGADLSYADSASMAMAISKRHNI